MPLFKAKELKKIKMRNKIVLPSAKNGVEPCPGITQLPMWISLLFGIYHLLLNYRASAIKKFSKHPANEQINSEFSHT